MNSNLKIQLNKQPFPHLVIKDLFTKDEISSIRVETDFLYQSSLSEASLTSSKSAGFPDGTILDKANYDVVYLDNVYSNLDNSIINTQIKNLVSQGIFFAYSQIEPWANRFRYFGLSLIGTSTKVNFFEPGHQYKAHRDLSEFTSLIYLHDEVKQFTGGLLNFPEFQFSYPCDHNTLILFPGRILHEVTEVSRLDKVSDEKPCRISINTFYSLFTHQPQKLHP